MNITQLQVKPFASYAKNVEEIPALIQRYLDAKDNTVGKHFKLIKDGSSKDTGHGMDYSDRLRIFHKSQDEPVYNTGYILYRPGAPFSTDHYELCINQVKLLDENSKRVMYGYRNGTGQVYVKECDTKGNQKSVVSFDLGARESELKKQVEPTDEKTFESWVSRDADIGDDRCVHSDSYFENENLCVVVARHCNRSVDATHDWCQVFVWKKGKGVAKSKRIYTHARASYTKFSTNYLRGKVSVNDKEEILYEGTSEFGDAKICESFILES